MRKVCGMVAGAAGWLAAAGAAAPTPPMGWNAWNAFGARVTAEQVRAAAHALVDTGLAAHGWRYVNIDDGWQGARDAAGNLQPNERFPDMKGLVDEIHALGLLAGIYSTPGPTSCAGFAGSWRHEYDDARRFAAWGFDYLKYDWCSYREVAYGTGAERARLPFLLMGAALRAQNREIVYSICQYGVQNVAAWGPRTGAQCWRTTGDVFDNWGSVYGAIRAGAEVWMWSGPGAWNDPDMLCVGRMRYNGFGESRLTKDEQRTQMTMWCLMAAPLLIGCDLTRLDGFTRGLLTNDEVIAIDQDALGAAAAKIAARAGESEIWARPLADGTLAVGLLNVSGTNATVTLDWDEAGLRGTWNVRDVWEGADEGGAQGAYAAEVAPHATKLIVLAPGGDGRLAEGQSDIRESAWMRVVRAARPVGAFDDADTEDCLHCKERATGTR